MMSSMMPLVDTTLSVNINRKMFHQTLAETLFGAVFEFKALGNSLNREFLTKFGAFEESLNVN